MVKYMKNKNCTIMNMDTNLLKLIAIVSMVIDHSGYILFSNNLIMRSIGRIAFPLFTYCTMIGYFKTKNLNKYILRLFIVGIISQPIYMFLFNTCEPNIMFTLVAELLLYYSLDKKKWWYLPFLAVIPFALKFDYGLIYLFLVPIFYYCRNNKYILSTLYISFYFDYLLDFILIKNSISLVTSFSILALPFILINTKSNIKINKYFFYIFYPLHLLILLIIKNIIM